MVQGGYDPGATVGVHASLLEYAVPVDHRAHCRADITRPDGSRLVLALPETDPGRFAASFVADLPGLYTIRARALGATFAGIPFQREQTLSAAVYAGATRPPSTGGGGGGAGADWCDFLECLLRGRLIDAKLIDRLRAEGLNPEALQKCLEGCCGHKRDLPPLR